MSKYLGQYFLINKSAITKIVDALELKSGDIVIEVGPGHGELTQELVKHPVKVIAVEKDKKLSESLEDAEVVTGDILKVLPSLVLKFKNYKLVGNIPYYITGYLLRIISELEKKPSLIVFTLQKEVAERIMAKPPRMNLLAASVQYWSEPEILMALPPDSFKPKPKVSSAVIKLEIKSEKLKVKEDYFKFIKILFKQPRKTVLNNLASNLNISKEKIKEKLVKLNIRENARPQNLNTETIEKLSNYVLR